MLSKLHKLSLIFVITSMAILFLCTYIHVARADEVYEFVKLGCYPESKSVSIRVFYESNEPGRDLFDHHGKDIYPILDPIIITCDLGNDETVSAGPSYTLPTGSGRQHIFIGARHMGITSLSSPYDLDYKEGFDLDIKPIGNGKFSVSYCSSSDTNFGADSKKQFAAQFKERKRICELVQDGHKTYTVDGTHQEKK